MAFPQTLDNFTNPTPSTPTNSPVTPLSGQLSQLNNAVEAIEGVIGVTGSTVPTSIEYRLADVQAVAAVALPATPAAAGTLIAAAADKATPSAADILALSDSAAGGILRGVTFTNLAKSFGLTRGDGDSWHLSSSGSSINAGVSGAHLFGGSDSQPNRIGTAAHKPLSDPGIWTRTIDAAYVAGSADVSAILSGYDNINNALAGLIASQHSMLYYGADHAAIVGGSLHTIKDDTDYSIILGGTNCIIEERGRYAAIIASDSCKLETGATDAEAGFRAMVASSSGCTVSGRNGVIVGSMSSSIASTYGTILAGESVVLTNGTHMVAAGNAITMGASSAATYSVAMGYDMTVDAGRVLASGEGHRVDANTDYSTVAGYRCRPPCSGARVFSARQRSGSVGYNQGLDWTASQETTDTTTTRLTAAGSSTYPIQPNDSIVSGTVYVVGVNSSGVSSAYKIDFVSERIGSGTPQLRQNVTTTQYDGLALPTPPTMNATSGGVYRVQVVGLAATNIRWNARFVGQQVVFT